MTINCPKCKSADIFVKDSRKAVFDKNSIKRRRECNTCEHRWNTVEIHEEVATALRDKKVKKSDNFDAKHLCEIAELNNNLSNYIVSVQKTVALEMNKKGATKYTIRKTTGVNQQKLDNWLKDIKS